MSAQIFQVSAIFPARCVHFVMTNGLKMKRCDLFRESTRTKTAVSVTVVRGALDLMVQENSPGYSVFCLRAFQREIHCGQRGRYS